MEKKKNSFKENWLKVDETCSQCGKVTKQVRGITKQNIRKLLIPKWNMTEVLITLLLLMLIILSFAYQNETQKCRDFLEPLYSDGGANCYNVCEDKCSLIIEREDNELTFNLTNLSLVG